MVTVIVHFPKKIDPVMEIIIRNKRETLEAERLNIADTHRMAIRLRVAAFILCVGYGVLWLL